MSHAFSATQAAQTPLLSPSTTFRRTNSLPNTVIAFAKPLGRPANKVSSSGVAKKPSGAISHSRRGDVLAEIQQSSNLESALARFFYFSSVLAGGLFCISPQLVAHQVFGEMMACVLNQILCQIGCLLLGTGFSEI